VNAVGIDWGSSSLRAYLFDGSHELIDQIESDQGITRIDGGAKSFEQTLLEVVANWRQPGVQILLSGMITSRNGWIETPYLSCPAKPGDLYDHAVGLELEGLELRFLPGVCQHGSTVASSIDVSPAAATQAIIPGSIPHVMPDVMRGEELQLLAIGPKTGVELLVLPGTHSKWALIDSSSIIAFRTIPTGELFDVLLVHSLIGGLAQVSGWSEPHFVDGVENGYTQDAILGQLFTCRSSVLLEKRSPVESRSWLSGLLIGREIREGVALLSGNIEMVRLVGSAKLCRLYEVALKHLDIRCETESQDAARLGYQQILAQLNHS